MREIIRPKFSMAAVRKETGLTDRQIRYYEEQGLIKPTRTKGNQRIFTAEEIQRLLEIKKLLCDGMGIEGIKEHFSQKTEPFLSNTYHTPSQTLAGMKQGLTSLYPVSNRAQLVEIISERRRAKEKNMK